MTEWWLWGTGNYFYVDLLSDILKGNANCNSEYLSYVYVKRKNREYMRIRSAIY